MEPELEDINVRKFSAMNRRRSEGRTGFNHELSTWSPGEWMNAILGELGEAANLVKKLTRIRDRVPGNKPEETPEYLIRRIGEELADTFIYLDLTFQSFGLDLSAEVQSKFRATSKKIGWEDTPSEHTASSGPLLSGSWFSVVTNEMYKAAFPEHTFRAEQENRPACVNYESAKAYCEKVGCVLPSDDELNAFLVREMVSSPYYYWTTTIKDGLVALRGGAWLDLPQFVRISDRNWDVPSIRFYNLGFRCTPAETTNINEGQQPDKQGLTEDQKRNLLSPWEGDLDLEIIRRDV
jgi:NTP pyrophosphatase (non-canonical NTP hydrolase)